MKRRFVKRVALLLVLTTVFAYHSLYAEPVRIGVTYSQKECETLGINQDVAYRIILSENFDVVRLFAYWDEIEKEEFRYDYKRLNLQIKEATQRNIPIVLSVGIKGGRYPEFFIPEWLKEKIKISPGRDVSKNNLLREKALRFVKKTVMHYQKSTAVQYWQIENEPMYKSGKKSLFVGEDYLKEAASIIRETDKQDRPIIITVRVHSSRLLRIVDRIFTGRDPVNTARELGDIVGLNIHFIEKYNFFGNDLNVTPDEETRTEYLKEIIAGLKKEGKEVWATEIQAEPWNPGFSETQKEKTIPSGTPHGTEEIIKEIKDAGVTTCILTGAEYWLYKRMKFGDMTWMDYVKNLMGKSIKD